MRVLILGSTSPTGHQTVYKFFEAYPEGTAILYARNPSKLHLSISSNPSVTVVPGELSQLDRVESCFSQPIDAVISTLGPNAFRFQGTPIADFYRNLVQIMSKHGAKRLIALATPSFPDPHDKRGIWVSLVILLVRIVASNIYRDVRAMATTIREEGDKHGIDWTVGRVLGLTNKPRADIKDIRAGYVGDGMTSFYISRESIGEWWVGQIEDKQWIGKFPYVSN